MSAHTYRIAQGLLAPLVFAVFGIVSLPAASQSTNADISIAITATPDPVRPGELVQYVVTATNRSAVGQSFAISAQVPNHTTVAGGSFGVASAISQFGGCGSSVCPAGSTISWGFGNNPIAPGQSVTVQFAALVDVTNPPPNGTVIRSTASAVAGGISSATAGVDVVISTADLSLGMAGPSPVAPGGALSYTLEFGNPGGVSAPAAALTVAVPAGTSFVSATGGGALVGSSVQWDVGVLPAGGTGQRQMVLQVDPAAANGSVVAAAADLRDAVTGRSLARANAAAVVLTNASTQVAITATPDPVRPGELVQYVVTATNRSTVGQAVRVSAQVPNHTAVTTGSITQGGGCGGGVVTCPAGATISWDFGNNPVAPGQSVTVQFAALVDVTNPPPNGTVIRSTASAVAGGISSASAGVDVTVQGGASSAPPVLSTDRTSLSFGTVQVGSSKDLTLTVTNTGAGTLTGTATTSASFSVAAGSPFSLSAGQSQIVTVRFAPSTATAFGGQLSIASNGGSPTVQLSGTGTPLPAPILSLSTSVLVFPGTIINSNSLPAVITITNTGGADLILGAASLGGANPGDFVIAGNSCSGATLPPTPAPGSSCTLSVSFGPTSLGTRSASVSIPSNAAGSPSSVSLSGTGLAAPAPAVTLSASSLTFGSITVGANSLQQSVVLTNTGAANLVLGALSLAGANPGDYLVVTNTCGNATLIPNGTCTFSVSFQPTATGTRTASATISSNATGSPHSVSLTGTGAAQAAPAVTLSANSLPFNSQTIGTTRGSLPVVLTNSGTANLVLGTLTLAGANPGDYVVGPNNCNNATLIPNGTCSFSVSFKPTAIGTRTASASISSNALGSPHSVGLAGTGTVPPPAAGSILLTVKKNGTGNGTVTSRDGSVNCGSTCMASVRLNSHVSLTAIAAPGSMFVGWSRSACPLTRACSFVASKDEVVTATFIPAPLNAPSKIIYVGVCGAGVTGNSPALLC